VKEETSRHARGRNESVEEKKKREKTWGARQAQRGDKKGIYGQKGLFVSHFLEKGGKKATHEREFARRG